MHGRAISKVLGQISAQHVNDKGRRLTGRKHGDLCALAHGHQRIRCRLSVGQDQKGGFKRDDARDTAHTICRQAFGDVGDFTLTQYLYAVRVDVIQITHQVGTRSGSAHGHFIEPALGSAQSGDPFPAQLAAKLFK
jgi:hypothetical protein